MTQFPDRLKEIRNHKNVKQREVAEHIGMQTRSYQAYEGGDREPNIATLIALADFFQVTLDYLMGRTDA